MKNNNKSDVYRNISLKPIKAPNKADNSVKSSYIKGSTDLRVRRGK